MCLKELKFSDARSRQVCLRNRASALDLTQTRFSPPSSLVFLISSRASCSSLPLQINFLVIASISLAYFVGSGITWHWYQSLLNFSQFYFKISWNVGKINIPKMFRDFSTFNQGRGQFCFPTEEPIPIILDLWDLFNLAPENDSNLVKISSALMRSFSSSTRISTSSQ